MFEHIAVDLPRVLVLGSFNLPFLTSEMASEFMSIIILIDLPRLPLVADHLPGFYCGTVEVRSSTGRLFPNSLVMDTSSCL